MAFEVLPNQIPSTIGNVTIRALRVPGGEEVEYRGNFSVEIIDQNGNTMIVKTGDLLPHLDATQKASLKSLIDDLHNLAQTLLP